MFLRQLPLAIIFCAFSATGMTSPVEDDENNASGREATTARYKDFLRYVREKSEAGKGNKAAIEELKAKRLASQAERETARKERILVRDEERRRFNSAARDEVIRREEEAMLKERDEKEKLYVEKRNQVRRAMKGVKQVDPHDEFQVGKHYEEFEYEEIDEEKEK